MTLGTCDREEALLAARRSPAGLGAEAREHAARCARCGAALAAEVALAPWSRRSLPAALPPAAAVLLRARLAARRRALERSVAPLALWRCLALAAAATAVAMVGWGAVASGSAAAASAPAAPTPAELTAGLGLLVLAGLPFLRQLRQRGPGAL